MRVRKIRSVPQLLQLVLLYCGLDLSLRSCAGQVAQLQGYLSDTATGWRVSLILTPVPVPQYFLGGVMAGCAGDAAAGVCTRAA